jgi:hypothetical protein
VLFTDALPNAAIAQNFRLYYCSPNPRVVSMPNYFHIERTLRVSDRTFSENELLVEPGVAIILAEPGAGKTSLLGSVASRLETRPVTDEELGVPSDGKSYGNWAKVHLFFAKDCIPSHQRYLDAVEQVVIFEEEV